MGAGAVPQGAWQAEQGTTPLTPSLQPPLDPADSCKELQGEAMPLSTKHPQMRPLLLGVSTPTAPMRRPEAVSCPAVCARPQVVLPSCATVLTPPQAQRCRDLCFGICRHDIMLRSVPVRQWQQQLDLTLIPKDLPFFSSSLQLPS